MEEKKKYRIGVIIGNLDAPHAFETGSGIVHAAEESGDTAVFFPAMFAQSYYEKAMLATTMEYDYQNTGIFHYIDKRNCDALIISMGTIRFYINLDHEAEKAFMELFKEIPCIIIEDHIPGYPSVTLNNVSGLEDCLNHLVHDHGYTKIGFFSGDPQNYDAKERLGVYHKVMEENHLPHDESYVGYGMFTEYTDDEVGALLDRHPDLQAIAFANDMMALGGYREIKRRGLEVGRDIAVTGFDDFILSGSMEPPLTTVRVSAYQLGATAFYQALKAAKGEPVTDCEINSELVIRNSCGIINDQDRSVVGGGKRQVTLSEKFAFSILHNSENRIVNKQIEEICQNMVDEISRVTESACDSSDTYRIVQIMQNLISPQNLQYVQLEKVFSAINDLMIGMLMQCDNDTKRMSLMRIFSDILGFLSNYIANDYQVENIRYRKQMWYSTFITRDSMVYSADQAMALREILVKLRDLGFKNTYIYLFKEPVLAYSIEDLREKRDVYLAACLDEEGIHTYEADEPSAINSGHNFGAQPKHENATTTVTYNLYANEEQYGFITFESELKDFSFAYTNSLQIGTALKYLHLMRKQMSMQKQLEQSLEDIGKKNDLLSLLSTSDDMTGLYNRRGFLTRSQELIDEHKGSMAAFVFIDMDNLKGINDIFGHSEGDYALKKVGDILRNCFRDKDIIGRIGGDEFAAFILIDEPGILHRMQKAIDTFSQIENDTNGKPYYIEMSFGAKEFICKAGINLNDIMKQADTELYADKKNKRKSCVKD